MILNKIAKYSSNLPNNIFPFFCRVHHSYYCPTYASLWKQVYASWTDLLFYYIFNYSADMNNFVVFQNFIWTEFNRFFPIVVTLQVLQDTFV